LQIVDRGVQMAGYFDHQTGKFVYVEEMEPELVVPDLTDFKVNFSNLISCFFYKSISVVESICFI
jgi:hypothetical protein